MLSLGWGTKTSNRPQWWWWAWAWDNDSSLLRDRVEGLESYYWGQEYNPQDTWGLLSNQGFPNYGEWVSTTQWWQASYSFPNHCFWVISVDRQPLWLEEDSKEWEKGTLVSLKSILKNKERFLWGRPLFILAYVSCSAKLAKRIYYPVSSSHLGSKDRLEIKTDLNSEAYQPPRPAMLPVSLGWTWSEYVSQRAALLYLEQAQSLAAPAVTWVDLGSNDINA